MTRHLFDEPEATAQAGVSGASEEVENVWQGTCNPCHSPTGGILSPQVDTLSLVCSVDSQVYERLVALSGRRLLIDPNGEISTDSPRIGSLPGSYDPNVWVQPWTVNGAPGLKVEGSAHRHILGHNVFGGPFCPVLAAKYLISVCEAWLGCKLPVWSSWAVNRLDLAWVFDVRSEGAALAFISEVGRSLATTTAARKLPRNFGTCVYLGRSKLYMKGPELRAHMPEWLNNRQKHDLLRTASSRLRFEVTFSRRDIDRLTFSELGKLDIRPLHSKAGRKLEQFARTSGEAMEQVRTTTSVQNRLSELYSSARAAALMGTWFKLTTLGEKVTKAGMTNTSYYRHMQELKAAGVSWTGTDIVRIQKLAFPEDFSLSIRSPYLVRTGEHPEVTRVLSQFAA